MVSELMERRSMELYTVPQLNISNCVTVTLTQQNYILWKSQFESFLSGQGLLGFVTGSISAPSPTIPVPDINGVTTDRPNPEFDVWFKTDKVVKSWLLGSFAEDILSVVVNYVTAHELQRRLQTLEKKDKPMQVYLKELQTIYEQLASVGSPVPEKMKIFAALNGLGREYEPIKTSIEGSIDIPPTPKLDEIMPRLNGYDDRLQAYAANSDVSPHLAFNTVQANSVFYTNRGRGQGNRRFGGSRGQERPTCQICGKHGHHALNCWHRFDNSYQLDVLPQALPATQITDITDHSGSEWVTDSAATAHITNSPRHLQQTKSYAGSDSVMVGNGNFLPITHTGSTSIGSTSVTKDYPCIFEFDCDEVRVRDKETKKLLLQGSNRDGLYVLDEPKLLVFYSSRQVAASDEVWHRRLGHPNPHVLQQLSSTKSILINKHSKAICEACQSERIHCDLWGPSPVMSVQGFRYYVIFIDNYSRYCWFYPLKLKSDFYTIFAKFQALVQNQLQSKISIFQCHGGGEFTSKVPQKHWVEAFYTTNFLSNLLPHTALTDAKSPFELLNKKKPDYQALRIFGCACFPTLRDYAQHKFDPKSLKCVFLGYNEKYKGYRCLLPTTGRVYISRHVIFDEHSFPFSDTYMHLQPTGVTPLLSAWQQSFMPQTTASSTASATATSPFNAAEIQVSPVITSNNNTGASVLENGSSQLPIQNSSVLSTVASEESSECTESINLLPIGNSSSSLANRTDNADTSPLQEAATETNSSTVQEAAESTTSSTMQEPASNQSTHPMITRSKKGITKPNPRYGLLTHKVKYAEPKTVTEALKHPGWTAAMHEEYDNCTEAQTWSLVPYTSDMNVLGSKWVFRTKLNADGSLDKLKARLVAKGFDQEEGIDYLETYSHVVRSATVRMVLHVATVMDWEVKQMDVKNAFLHGDLTETVYMLQPAGFVNKEKPTHVCHLHKALYGLKQAPRAWFDKFSNYLLEFGFNCSIKDPSLFIYLKGNDLILLLLYVDDMVLTENEEAYGNCKLCRGNLPKIYYYCLICDFSIDLICAKKEVMEIIEGPKAHEHPLFLLPKMTMFTCHLCGLQDDRFPYACNLCNLSFHKDCAESTPEMKYSCHPKHILKRLTRVPSVDINCAKNPLPSTIVHLKAHEHLLTLMPQRNFVCDACGMDDDPNPYIVLYIKIVPQALPATQITDITDHSGSEWVTDSAATAHITNSPRHLQQTKSYAGSDSVMVGNGNFLPITHTGSTSIGSTSVTKDYPCIFEFDCDEVRVRDKETKKLLLQGSNRDGLYVLDEPKLLVFYSSRQVAASDEVWHRRLGHPNPHVLQQLSSTKSILINKHSKAICEACQSERIHCDLWGPSPVMSVQGFRYYVIFIDNYSRYCWFYPLKLKSDFYTIFAKFQALVQNQLQSKISIFQCHGGGEFTSKVPQKHWVEAFYTTNFLSNLLPHTALTDAKSPFELLNKKKPDYQALRIFGCACFPTLRDYAQHKFDPKSLKCVFLGYNEKYKGYRCLLPTTGRVYISRHVIFDEHSFPFSDTYMHLQPTGVTPLLSAWQQSFMPQTTASSTASATATSPFNAAEIQVSPVITSNNNTGASVLENGSSQLPIQNSSVLSTVASEESSECTESINLLPIGNSSSSLANRTDNADTSPLQEAATETNSSTVQEAAESTTSSTMQEPASNQSTHPMITRSKKGITKPNPRYGLLTHKVKYAEPKTVTEALKHPGWTAAMHEEYDNCTEAQTWSLVPYTSDMNVLGSKWVFRTKLNADGSLDKLKARLVAKGFDQEEGIDYLETYSHVVRSATVRMVLHVATVMDWEVKQMDVKNAFLHGDLTETVYMLQPAGFVNKEKPTHVCHLHKALYGLKQAPRAWFDKFSNYLLEFGFNCSIKDPSLFIYLKGNDLILLLLYVDDMVLTGSNSATMIKLLEDLNTQFRMKDLGQMHYFLGTQA
ncbi:reverse transcriptase like protein [Arabidopsis thaliana]|uniref:Reverse transcriptase like protein n=1 Tax=Arabidopsis thaliana TaxID=3702 RepID=O23450_ARATH|nr:reverse transcriptase like protein [Arabidopsis thaliana]CAB78643.1 reverse transcriptase like protein [Arabidopsis thaliana]